MIVLEEKTLCDVCKIEVDGVSGFIYWVGFDLIFCLECSQLQNWRKVGGDYEPH